MPETPESLPAYPRKRPGRRANGEHALWQDKVSGGWTAQSKPIRHPITGKAVRPKRSGRSRTAALAALRQAVADIENAKPPQPPQHTVASWAAEWLAEVEHTTAPSTMANYRPAIRRLVRHCGAIPLRDLDDRALGAMYRAMYAEGVRVGGVEAVHRAVRTCLADAVDHGEIPRSPASRMKLPNPPNRKAAQRRATRPLTRDEVRAVLAVAKDAGQTWHVRWLLGIGLGLRQGEALGLGTADVDLTRMTIQVHSQLQYQKPKHGCGDGIDVTDPDTGKVRTVYPCGRYGGSRCPQGTPAGTTRLWYTKSGLHSTTKKEREVPMPPVIADAIGALMNAEPGGHLWTDEITGEQHRLLLGIGEQPIRAKRDWDMWQKILHAAGVERVRVHDARHTAATMMLEGGVPDRVVMDVLGWSQRRMLDSYQHSTDGLRDRASQVIGQALDGM